MPDYGWAYINLDVLKTIQGPSEVTGTIAIIIDDTTFSGSQFLAYATASNKVGIGLDFPTVVPTHQLHVSASAGEEVAANFTGDILVSGSAFISGTLRVENIQAKTVISSSHLLVRDPVIGLGFGDGSNQTGSVGDRGIIFGLAGNLNQAIIWDQSSGSFIVGKVGSQGPDSDSYTMADADLSTFKVGVLTASAGLVTNTVSASHNVSIVGNVATEGTLSVSGSTVLGHASSNNTTITGQTINIPNVAAGTDNTVVIYNGSTLLTDEIDSKVWDGNLIDVTGTPSDNQVVTFADADTVQGESNLTFDGSTLTVGNDISVAGKLVHTGDTDTHVKFDADKIELIAGNETLLTLTEDSQDIVIVGDGGDVDFQVKTSGNNNTIFAQGSTDRVGLGTSSPNAVLEISRSVGMAKPMFQVVHGGTHNNISDGKPLIIVTGSTPDGFTGVVGINTENPKGVLHVAGAGKTALIANAEGKVIIGKDTSTIGSTFEVQSDLNTDAIAKFVNTQNVTGDEGPFVIFHISGSSDGGGHFGSHHSGSNMHLSGTSFLTAVTASVGFSGSIGNFGTLNINSVAITQGTVDGTTIGGTTPGVVNQTAGTVKYRSKDNGDSPYSVVASDYIIGVDTSGGAVQINLQAASSAGTGRMLIIKDIKGTAGANNITIEPNGSEFIDRQANLIIAANSGSVMLFCDGSEYFIAGTR